MTKLQNNFRKLRLTFKRVLPFAQFILMLHLFTLITGKKEVTVNVGYTYTLLRVIVYMMKSIG